jgi:hypothetical protein
MMTREEMLAGLQSMFNFLKEEGPDEFMKFVNTLEPGDQEIVLEWFRSFVKMNLDKLSPDERKALEHKLKIDGRNDLLLHLKTYTTH